MRSIARPAPATRLRALPSAARYIPLLSAALAPLLAFAAVQLLRDGLRLEALACIALIVATTATAFRSRQAANTTSANSRIEALFWPALLVVAVACALLFRLNEIGSAPYGIWADEAENGRVARSILDGARPIFVGEASQLPALFFYVFAGALAVLGDNITSMRLVTIVAGVANVVFVYLLGRELFDRRTGVIAAFLLAVMRWHVGFSRFAMHGIFAPLFEVVGLYFLLRGLKGHGRWNFVVAGAAFGVGLQGYYSFVLMGPVVVLFLAHHWLTERRLATKDLLRGVALTGLTLVVVYAPLGLWATDNWRQFSERGQTVSITSEKSRDEAVDALIASTEKHLLMFNVSGDANGRHNIPGAPMLDEVTGILLIAGVGIALSRIHRSACFLLLVWAAVMLQAGIWSLDFEAPQAYRTLGITPAVALLAALPVAMLWRTATDLVPAGRDYAAIVRLGAGVATALVLALVARANYDAYFNQQLVRADTFPAFSAASTFAGREIGRIGPDARYRVTSSLFGPTLSYLVPNIEELDVRQFEWNTDLQTTATRDTVYLLDGGQRPFADRLTALYAGARLQTLTAPADGAAIAYEVIVPAVEAASRRGVKATYVDARGVTSTPIETTPGADAPVAYPVRATWWTSFPVESYGNHFVTLELPGTAVVYLDGVALGSGDGSLLLLATLYEGWHDLVIEADLHNAGTVTLALDGVRLPPEALSTIEPQGLLARVYAPDGSSTEPRLVMLDPLLGYQLHTEHGDIPGPIRVVWTGFIDVPTTGAYDFDLIGYNDVAMRIDGVRVSNDARDVHLEAGKHAIEVTLTNNAGSLSVWLRWTPPGQVESGIVPQERLFPR